MYHAVLSTECNNKKEKQDNFSVKNTKNIRLKFKQFQIRSYEFKIAESIKIVNMFDITINITKCKIAK